MTSADVIQRGAAAVDQESVGLKRNWMRAVAPGARGGRGESRGAEEWTIRSPERGRHPWLRRRAAVLGGGCGTERGGRGRRGARAPGAHQDCIGGDGEARGGTPATNRCPTEQRPEREERDGDGDRGVPGPIPASGKCSSARRMRWRHQLGSGWPEVAARCIDRDGVSGGQRGSF